MFTSRPAVIHTRNRRLDIYFVICLKAYQVAQRTCTQLIQGDVLGCQNQILTDLFGCLNDWSERVDDLDGRLELR